MTCRFPGTRSRRARSSFRANGRVKTVRLASYLILFGEDRQPDTAYLLVPKVSSKSRNYLPIGFCEAVMVASGSALIVPGAGKYEFGVLQAAMHMAWTRAVCGRLESRYQYSAGIVYNNSPWPDLPTAAQKQKGEQCA